MDGINQQPSVLTITKHGKDGYVYTLMRPGESFVGVQNTLEVRVAPNVVATLCKQIDQAADNALANPPQPGINFEPFISIGQSLYNEFFPRFDQRIENLRQQLRQLTTPLLISTDAPEIPWELFYDADGSGFWGLNFDIGRQLRTRTVPCGVPHREKDWRCLMIANPNADEEEWALRDSVAEVTQLRDSLRTKRIHCDYHLESEANLDSILGNLGRYAYDIIHYSGHIVFDHQTEEYALRLHGGELLPARTIRNQVRGNPIVFLNGCWSGKTKGLTNAFNSVAGLTDAFLEAGAQLVVGSLFEVSATGARAFAESFYDATLKSKTVGEAMRLARNAVKREDGVDQHEAQYSAAWACFIMYGDPCLKIEIEVDELQEALQKAMLQRADFDTSCRQVIEQAWAYGQPVRMVSSVYLFTAMIGGNDQFLQDRLRQRDLQVKDLQDDWCSRFSQSKAKMDASQSTVFSDNVAKMLRYANRSAQSSQGEGRITELDLLKGFVQQQGGSMRDPLRQLGIEIVDLDPRHSALKPRLGPLTISDCAPSAWRMLCHSMEIARQAGSASVRTRHLFAALMLEREGLVQSVLRFFQMEDSPLPQLLRDATESRHAPPNDGGSTPMPCSATVLQLLEWAQVLAAKDERAKVTERDLFFACVSHPSQLSSRHPDDVNTNAICLDHFCFNASAQPIIDKALVCRREKRYRVLGRSHVFYAMLALDNSLLVQRLQKQTDDVKALAVDFDKKFHEFDYTVSAEIVELSSGLIEVFQAAQIEGVHGEYEPIGEEALLRALLDLDNVFPDLDEFFSFHRINRAALLL